MRQQELARERAHQALMNVAVLLFYTALIIGSLVCCAPAPSNNSSSVSAPTPICTPTVITVEVPGPSVIYPPVKACPTLSPTPTPKPKVCKLNKHNKVRCEGN